MDNSNSITITYIGDKPAKLDTITGSRLVFPRHEPVTVASALAHRLLAYPDTWIKHDQLKQYTDQQRREQEHRQQTQKQAIELALELSEKLSYSVQTRNGEIDISKYTSAQLQTLAESENLDAERRPGAPVSEYRDRIRDALKARAAQ